MSIVENLQQYVVQEVIKHIEDLEENQSRWVMFSHTTDEYYKGAAFFDCTDDDLHIHGIYKCYEDAINSIWRILSKDYTEFDQKIIEKKIRKLRRIEKIKEELQKIKKIKKIEEKFRDMMDDIKYSNEYTVDEQLQKIEEKFRYTISKLKDSNTEGQELKEKIDELYELVGKLHELVDEIIDTEEQESEEIFDELYELDDEIHELVDKIISIKKKLKKEL